MLEFAVVSTDAPERLDRFLTRHLPTHSRAALQQLIAQGQILVDGRVVKSSYRLRAGEHITVTLPAPEPLGVRPEQIPLHVLYEDIHLLVLDKPAGMVVHPSPGQTSGTLVNALLAHCPHLSGIGGVERPGIVHRLDKDTSGVMVVAKDDLTHRGLARQFADRQVTKRYVAVVRGAMQQTEGVIDAPIGRHPVERQKMSTRSRAGRAAMTAYRVLERFGEVATLVELQPRTGRTHQIRVHMAAIGHPLLGDPVYGRSGKALKGSAIICQVAWFRRQALHAWELAFRHPVTGEHIACQASWPADFERLLATLQQALRDEVASRAGHQHR